MNFRYKLMQFMSGRYGIDKTFYVLFFLSAVFAIINCFVRSMVIQFVVYAIVIIAFLRFFSKNIDARIRENDIVTGWMYKLLKRIRTYNDRKKDIDHIYKKCPKCKAVLRLPRRKGLHKTICPKCKKEFKVRVLK